MKNLLKTAALGISLLTVTLLIGVQILVQPISVYSVQRFTNIARISGLTYATSDHITDATLKYLLTFPEPSDYLVGYLDRFYTQEEMFHLREVHLIFWQSRMVLVVLIGLIGVGGVVGTWSGEQIAGGLKLALVTDFLLILALLLLFGIFFETFHRLLFSPGTYSFSYRHTLIQLFPPAFWRVMFELLTMGSLAILGIGYVLSKRRYVSDLTDNG